MVLGFSDSGFTHADACAAICFSLLPIHFLAVLANIRPLDSLSPFGSMLNVSIQHRWVPCKCHWHLHCFANGKRLRRLSDRQCRETSRKRSFHSAALSFLRLAASAAGQACRRSAPYRASAIPLGDLQVPLALALLRKRQLVAIRLHVECIHSTPLGAL